MKEVNSVSDATNTYGEDIKLTTTDASTLYKTIITELEKGAGEPLYPGDERRIFGEALVRCQNQTRAEGLPHQSGDPRDHRLRR